MRQNNSCTAIYLPSLKQCRVRVNDFVMRDLEYDLENTKEGQKGYVSEIHKLPAIGLLVNTDQLIRDKIERERGKC